MKTCFVLAFFLLQLISCQKEELEKVSEDELLTLLRNEKYVIVLFTKTGCVKCDELETLLVGIREDLVDALNPWVVKTVDSNMVKLYSPSKEPALVFFRHGVPLLYDGKFNEDDILQVFSDNREPSVKELSDANFEGLTQAATGATTGDWFIMFYSNDCVECQRLQAVWEAVAGRLKVRMNVARINRKTVGRVTSRRFGIIEEPTFLFFRLGKMYYYSIPKYDVTSFVAFATDWYKNARSQKVPLPKAPFDDFIQQIVDFIRENFEMIKYAVIFLSILLLSLLVKYLRNMASNKDEVKAKSKSTTSSLKKTKKEK